MTWQELEKLVRQYAQAIWAASASAETINGIKCDCVVKFRPDYWIIVEISKENTLTKLRTDVAKFSSVRLYLLSQQIYSECIFVTEAEQSSLASTAEGAKVQLYSIRSFFDHFFGASQYVFARGQYPFGSAVDPDNGQIDKTDYVPIQYVDSSDGSYDVHRISTMLAAGKKILILGEFGSGKSRCVMEVFKAMAAGLPESPPIAINLRETWGLRAFHTILAEHMLRLGLGAFSENVIRAVSLGNNAVLLDGFDELGTQSWSGDKKRIREVRKKSFEGLRDLIVRTNKNGLLIAGREHYFSDNAEMFECLGLSEKDTVLLRCPDEFTEEETSSYLKSRLGIVSYPQWFPRKPLLCQVLTKLGPEDIKAIFSEELGEIKYFEKTLDVICRRETRHNAAVFPDSVKQLYLELARITKEKPSRVGPLTITDVYSAFEKVVGSPPVDESIVLLQRLAYLGRTGSGSDDRVFIDQYVADGLAALAMVEDYYNKHVPERSVNWRQSLGKFGLSIIGKRVKLDIELVNYLKRLSKAENTQMVSDYFAGVVNENDVVDMKNVEISGANIHYLCLASKHLSNFSLADPTIEELVIENCVYSNVSFAKGVFGKTFGISSREGFPVIFTDCDSGEYDSATDVSKIGDLSVSYPHKTLLCIVKKLFFQPGSGRKEEALLRGSEKYWDDAAARTAINYMVSNRMVTKVKGEAGTVYVPQRQYTVRLGKMYAELNNSKEEIWRLVRG